MAFTKFDASNMEAVRQGDCTIRFARCGKNTVSKALATALDIKDGDKLSIVQDDETDWHLLLRDTDGFTLRKPKDAGCLIFQSTAMAKTILDALEHEDESIGFRVVTTPQEIDGDEYYLILTSGPIKGR